MKHSFINPTSGIRSLALALCLFTVITAASCAESKTPSASSDTTAAPAEDTTSADDVDFSSMTFIEKLAYDRNAISDNLPAKNYDDADFTIAFLDQGPGSMYYTDWIAEELDGEVINDAVYTRNSNVSDRFGVTLKTYSCPNTGEYSGTVENVIMANEDAFQLISLHPGYYSTFLLHGYFRNLNEIESIDFTRPWWLGDSVTSYSYKGVSYVAFGMATPISVLADSPVMYFNKNIAADYNLEDFYSVVRAGKWTYDYVLNIVKDLWTDIDGDGKVSNNDSFGFHYPMNGQGYRFTWSLGGKYITNNAEGEPELSINNEKMLGIFQNMRDLTAADGVNYTSDYASTVFIEGRALLEQANLSNLDGMRDVTFEYGILPNFKLDESQENYLTNGGGGPQAIPITCADVERAGIITEALNAEGYKQIVPAYYETAVKLKYSYDNESAEMLDLIFSNVVFDGSYVFCHDATYVLQNYITGKTEFASWYGTVENSYTKKLAANIESFAAAIESGN